MSGKRLERVGASYEQDERYRPTGKVELRAIPGWLKSATYVTAQLTPTEARGLAIALLNAAERAASAGGVS